MAPDIYALNWYAPWDLPRRGPTGNCPSEPRSLPVDPLVGNPFAAAVQVSFAGGGAEADFAFVG